MAKISELPVVAAPVGTETVVVQSDGIAKQVPLGPLAGAALAPHVADANRVIDGKLAASSAVIDGKVTTATQAATRSEAARTAAEAAREAALGTNKVCRLVLTGGNENQILVTSVPATPLVTGTLVILQPNVVNTGKVTVAIDGAAPLPLYRRNGQDLQAGQLKPGHWLARVAGAGETLQLILLEAVESAPIQPGLAGDDVDVLSARRVVPLIARARRVVDGRVYALTNNRDGSVTVSLSQGRIWDEDKGGAPAFRIAAAVDQTLGVNAAIVVDLDGPLDGSGRLTPTVINLGSFGAIGWQTGNRVVLFSHTTSSAGAEVDQIYGGGGYRLMLPVPDINPVTTNARRARRAVDGRIYKQVNNLNGTVTVSLSQGRVWREGNNGVIEYRIEGMTDVVLAANQAIVADLDTVDANGTTRVVPTIVNLAAASAVGWQSGNKLVLYSHTTSSAGADIDQIYGGGAYRLDPTRSSRDLSLMLVRVQRGSTGAMAINIPSAKTRWTSWRFINSVDTVKNCDVWRSAGVSDVTLSTEGVVTSSIALTRPSELETAVRQPGRADFSGGVSHGNHVKSEVRAFADGKEFDPSAVGPLVFSARQVDVYQTSALYDHANAAIKIMDVYTHWRWTVAGLRLSLTYVIVGNPTFDIIYAGMFPVYRNNGVIDLVTKGRRSPARLGMYEEDLAAGYAEHRSKASELTGYGGGYLFRAAKVAGYDDATAPNRTTYFAPTVDNKFYFNQIDAAMPQAFVNGTVIGPVVTDFEVGNPN